MGIDGKFVGHRGGATDLTASWFTVSGGQGRRLPFPMIVRRAFCGGVLSYRQSGCCEQIRVAAISTSAQMKKGDRLCCVRFWSPMMWSNGGVQILAESWFHEALVVQLEFKDMRFKNKNIETKQKNTDFFWKTLKTLYQPFSRKKCIVENF